MMVNEREKMIAIPCIKVRQPIGTFYVGVIGCQKLLRISYADIRRIEGRDVENYIGIERPLDPKRVNKIKQYVRTVDATFPSAIIVAVESINTDYNAEEGILFIADDDKVARIIDGQHRLAGLEDYVDSDFDLIVTIFVDIDMENQAMIFATINLEQTKVNKSLVYDLFEFAKQRSPEKTSHTIAMTLNAKEGSPFKNKIKILGSAGSSEETVSQALFVDALLKMISDNPMLDRDLLKRGQTLTRATTDMEEKGLIFRNMFIDKQDSDIAVVLWNYFGAVQAKWGNYWNEPIPGYLLNRTTGIGGLMLFLPYAYRNVASSKRLPTEDDFDELFARVGIDAASITRDNYPPGSGGQAKLRDLLITQLSQAI